MITTPDQRANCDWILTKANLLMLEADYRPHLPGYFLAGIPEYPQLFGCDNTYTAPGATAAGFSAIMRSTLALLGDYALRARSRVPHETATNRRVSHHRSERLRDRACQWPAAPHDRFYAPWYSSCSGGNNWAYSEYH